MSLSHACLTRPPVSRVSTIRLTVTHPLTCGNALVSPVSRPSRLTLQRTRACCASAEHKTARNRARPLTCLNPRETWPDLRKRQSVSPVDNSGTVAAQQDSAVSRLPYYVGVLRRAQRTPPDRERPACPARPNHDQEGTAMNPKTSVDHCTCPPNHPAHQRPRPDTQEASR